MIEYQKQIGNFWLITNMLVFSGLHAKKLELLSISERAKEVVVSKGNNRKYF